MTIPKLYSAYAIDKVYQNGLVCEDKQFVTYYLLSRIILEDMIAGIFEKEYIVLFQTSLFSKKEKLRKLFSIIDNDLAKELISFQINYQEFLENKEVIYKWMRDGYQFTLLIDETFLNQDINLEQLDVFKYLLVKDEKYLNKRISLKKNLLKLR